jgi:hypothetical protein
MQATNEAAFAQPTCVAASRAPAPLNLRIYSTFLFLATVVVIVVPSFLSFNVVYILPRQRFRAADYRMLRSLSSIVLLCRNTPIPVLQLR